MKIGEMKQINIVVCCITTPRYIDLLNSYLYFGSIDLSKNMKGLASLMQPNTLETLNDGYRERSRKINFTWTQSFLVILLRNCFFPYLEMVNRSSSNRMTPKTQYWKKKNWSSQPGFPCILQIQYVLLVKYY